MIKEIFNFARAQIALSQNSVVEVKEAKIAEIFQSKQGEGPDVGKPCTFIRFSGCNMSCHFCDEASKNKRHLMTAQQIANQVVFGENRSMVVFTGGEPLLQQKSVENIIDEIDIRNKLRSWKICFETNGSIFFRDDLVKRLRTHEHLICCSPKLSRTGRCRHLLNWAINRARSGKFVPNIIVKIVVDGEGMTPTHYLNEFEHLILQFPLWIMPEGNTKERMNRNMKYARRAVEKFLTKPNNGVFLSERRQVVEGFE